MKRRVPRATHSRILARIADANANRAREGLRVAEDLFRLGFNDARSGLILKTLRRELTRAVESSGLAGAGFWASRDARSDPGSGRRAEPGPSLARRNWPDLLSANLRRAQESLRVLEELDRLEGGKGLSFRKLRFRAYEAESFLQGRLNKELP